MRDTLTELSGNKQFLDVLKNVGIAILVLACIAVVIMWIGFPVWLMTHQLHHSKFTWYLVWSTFVGLTAFLIMIIIAVADS